MATATPPDKENREDNFQMVEKQRSCENSNSEFRMKIELEPGCDKNVTKVVNEEEPRIANLLSFSNSKNTLL